MTRLTVFPLVSSTLMPLVDEERVEGRGRGSEMWPGGWGRGTFIDDVSSYVTGDNDVCVRHEGREREDTNPPPLYPTWRHNILAPMRHVVIITRFSRIGNQLIGFCNLLDAGSWSEPHMTRKQKFNILLTY